jgi:hypothetical protein
MTVSLLRNSVRTQFYENQSCDSKSKMATHAHTYTHCMVILLILFVFILRKEIWLKMLYDRIMYRTCFCFNTSTSQNVGKVFLFAALSYAVVSTKSWGRQHEEQWSEEGCFCPECFVDTENAVYHECAPQGQTISHSFCLHVWRYQNICEVWF